MKQTQEIPLHLRPYLRRHEVAKLLGMKVGVVDQMPLPWAAPYPGARAKLVSRADLDAYLKAARGAVPE